MEWNGMEWNGMEWNVHIVKRYVIKALLTCQNLIAWENPKLHSNHITKRLRSSVNRFFSFCLCQGNFNGYTFENVC